MRLKSLVGERNKDVTGAAGEIDIRGLSADSRRVEPGFLYAALPGSKTDGSQFIADAIKRGAVAVLAPAGTAQKIIGGRYSNSINVTSFAGVFPMDEPRYVIVVMLDEPKATAETFGFTTAGWNVAPVVSKTVSRIAPMLGVRPDKNREPNLAEVLPFVHEDK